MDEIDRIERRLKLNDVRVLMSVVQAGSMNKAAERLATSQPAVSRAIRDLEHAFGVRLLDRSSTGIEPTECGRAIIKRGLAVFDELRQGFKDIAFLTDPTMGELRIGCTEHQASGPVLAVVERLTRRHPRMAFELATGGALRICRDLAERRVEVAILGMAEPLDDEGLEILQIENLRIEKLCPYERVVAAGVRNRWTRRPRIELAELVNEPWTLSPPDTGLGAFAARAFRTSGLEPPRATIISLSRNVRDKLLATGRFLTMMPNYSFMHPARDSSLKALPVRLPNARGTVVIATLKNRTLSPLAELFIKSYRADVTP